MKIMKKIKIKDWEKNVVFIINRGFKFLGYPGKSDMGQENYRNETGGLISWDAVMGIPHESFRAIYKDKFESPINK